MPPSPRKVEILPWHPSELIIGLLVCASNFVQKVMYGTGIWKDPVCYDCRQRRADVRHRHWECRALCSDCLRKAESMLKYDD
jgi:hypothetical protein